jgi:ribosomal protein S18 acetylase RimI-like enzyme
MADTSIHLLTPGELDAANEMIMLAYNLLQSRKNILQRYLVLQPDGSFVVTQDGRIIGFCAAKKYRSFAYIGLMAVHPAVQKQGIGHMLLGHILDWLDTCGCPTVLLDATPSGIALYKRHAFVEDDTTVVLRQDGVQVTRVDEHDEVSGNWDEEAGERNEEVGGDVAPVRDQSNLNGDELSALVAFDALSFGSERAAVLASYLADAPERVLITYNTDGQIAGYLIVQSGVFGPWVAETVDVAEKLLVQALTLPFKSSPSIFVSAQNEHALLLFERYGFKPQRTLSHMRRGEQVQRGRHTTVYGQASLGLG